MERTLGSEIEDPIARQRFLEDNCDAVVDKGYMKPFSPEELQGHKENLANLSIQIAEIESEQKLVAAQYKGQLKPLREQRADLVSNIKAKSEYVTEKCYRFTDQETKTTGFYNADGILIESRPATADELEPTIYSVLRSGRIPNEINN